VTIKMIPELTDVPKWKDHGTAASMSKHFRVFETYLSHHFRVEGFPLDWVVRPSHCKRIVSRLLARKIWLTNRMYVGYILCLN
jgi:hypothetical protein